MLYVNVLCALIKKRQATSSVEDKTTSCPPKKTRMILDHILDQISFADRHLSFPDTGSLTAIQPRNPAAFRRLLVVLEDTHTPGLFPA